MAQIRVEYFAIFREHVGQPTEQVQTSAPTVAALWDELDRRHDFPGVGQLKVAVNDEFAAWDAPLADGDRVVFIPPVAGG